jgi:dienelactone hydrolase
MMRSFRRFVLVAALVTLAVPVGRAQQNPAVDHAKRILDLLKAEKFYDVAKEFNAQVAGLLPASQLASVWKAVLGQAGAFTSIIDEQVRTPGTMTAVILGCQFEKTALNLVVAFDADDKIAGLQLVPRQAARQQAPAPSSDRFKEEAVTVGGDVWSLPGTLSMPVGRIAGALVLVHGSGPSDRDETVGANAPFRDLAWGLADRGVAVLRYEKRTRQYPARVVAITNLTVREETIDDAIRAAAMLRAHDRIDPKRVFVLGHSLGGTVAPRIAAEDRALAGIVIMAGSTRPLADVAREQIAYLASLTPNVPSTAESREATLQTLLRAAPDSYWKDLDAYKPAQTAATLTIPMLILQGERDYQVTMDDLKGWRDALERHAGVTIKSYPALNHLFLPGEGKSTPAEYQRPGHIPDAVLDDIAAWIASR